VEKKQASDMPTCETGGGGGEGVGGIVQEGQHRPDETINTTFNELKEENCCGDHEYGTSYDDFVF
jgi:hypothetical protein